MYQEKDLVIKVISHYIIFLETTKEKEDLKKYTLLYMKDITQVLNDVRHEMLLLLKTNEFLRNIDRRMGNPVDNFGVMVINILLIYR
jgi:hypothetical protein